MSISWGNLHFHIFVHTSFPVYVRPFIVIFAPIKQKNGLETLSLSFRMSRQSAIGPWEASPHRPSPADCFLCQRAIAQWC